MKLTIVLVMMKSQQFKKHNNLSRNNRMKDRKRKKKNVYCFLLFGLITFVPGLSFYFYSNFVLSVLTFCKILKECLRNRWQIVLARKFLGSGHEISICT